MAVPVVEMRHVTKCFAKVIANKDVSLTVGEGEVLALLGENGAGKSTIMKILYGLYGLDEGEILIRGQQVQIKNPADAMARGIAMIQQHFSWATSTGLSHCRITTRDWKKLPRSTALTCPWTARWASWPWGNSKRSRS